MPPPATPPETSKPLKTAARGRVDPFIVMDVMRAAAAQEAVTYAFDGSFEPEPRRCDPADIVLLEGVFSARPELADLLERFRFVPNWRLDDVMVSYAADGGGVGPHGRRGTLGQGAGR